MSQWEVLGSLLERPRKSQSWTTAGGGAGQFLRRSSLCYTPESELEAPAENLSAKSTVHDYLKAWSQSDAFRRIFAAIISQLIEEGRVNLEECFVDATFAAAKGGGTAVGSDAQR